MSEGQQESQTSDSGTTPNQPHTDWRSVAHAAANIPNPMYVTRADVSDPPTNKKTKVIGLCKKLWQISGPVFFVANVILLSYFVAKVTTLCGEFGPKDKVADLVRTELNRLGVLPEFPGSPLRMRPAGPPGPPGSPGQKGAMGPAGLPGVEGPMGPTCTVKPPEQPHAVSCPDGYSKFYGTCYKVFTTCMTFSDAASACRAEGGTLAMPRDAETNAFLTPLYKSVSIGSAFWIGLHDRREEGRFEWVDGTAPGMYSSWEPSQPDDRGGSEDCVAYAPLPWAGKWVDAPCRFCYGFICQAIPGRE